MNSFPTATIKENFAAIAVIYITDFTKLRRHTRNEKDIGT